MSGIIYQIPLHPELLYVPVSTPSLQSYPTPHDPMDYSLPGSSVHGILQAGILTWAACPVPVDLPGKGSNPCLLCLLCLLHLLPGQVVSYHQCPLGSLYFCTFMLKYGNFLKFILNFVFTRLLHELQSTSIRMVRFFSLFMILIVIDNHCLYPLINWGFIDILILSFRVQFMEYFHKEKASIINT